MGALRRSLEKLRAWRTRSAKKYEERVREEVLAGDRPWSSLPPVNRSQRRREFKRAFGSQARVCWVQRQPCIVCARTPCENAHVRSRGAGGGPKDIVPLCRKHHHEQHTDGIQTFAERYSLDLEAAARETHERWLDEREAA